MNFFLFNIVSILILGLFLLLPYIRSKFAPWVQTVYLIVVAVAAVSVIFIGSTML